MPLRKYVEQSNVLLKLVPKRDGVAFSVHAAVAAPCRISCLWKLVLAVWALSLEERESFVAFLADLSLLARERDTLVDLTITRHPV